MKKTKINVSELLSTMGNSLKNVKAADELVNNVVTLAENLLNEIITSKTQNSIELDRVNSMKKTLNFSIAELKTQHSQAIAYVKELEANKNLTSNTINDYLELNKSVRYAKEALGTYNIYGKEQSVKKLISDMDSEIHKHYTVRPVK